MSTVLRHSLDDTDYERLMTLARGMISGLAPDWTDYNVHDPGIMLLELLAAAADEQIYALGRMRADERFAYAAAMGERPRGALPSRSMIWPAAGNRLAVPAIVARAAVAKTGRDGDPPFSTESPCAVWLTGANIARLMLALPAGGAFELPTKPEAWDQPVFVFGEKPAVGARLDIAFDLPVSIPAGSGEPLAFNAGVLWAGPEPSVEARGNVIAIAADCGGEVVDLDAVADTSRGLSRSGVLSIDVSQLAGKHLHGLRLTHFSGAVAPRLLGIALDAFIVVQMERRSQDFRSNGLPGQCFSLAGFGTIPHGEAVAVDVDGATQWQPVSVLGGEAPASNVFQLDPSVPSIKFGNGINGAIPSEGATITVEWAETHGSAGNIPGRLRWRLAGAGPEFLNMQAAAGGRDRDNLADLRRRVRKSLSAEKPIVTDADLVAAAMALTGLEVARAIVLPSNAAVEGVRTLLAIREKAPGADPYPLETREWLAELYRRLAPRLVLGERLSCVGPRYARFAIEAEVRVQEGREGASVVAEVRRMLSNRLALTKAMGATEPWPPGKDVRVTDIAGLIMRVAGVERCGVVSLLTDGGVESRVALDANSLPWVTDIRIVSAARSIQGSVT